MLLDKNYNRIQNSKQNSSKKYATNKKNVDIIEFEKKVKFYQKS